MMIAAMKRLGIMGAVTIVFSGMLTGCGLFYHLPPEKMTTLPVIVEPDLPEDKVETPPQIKKTIDWQQVLSPFVEQLLHASYEGKKILLISDIQNRSGDYISTQRIDTILHNLMNNQSVFTVIDQASINQVKKVLNISPDDKLVSRSKMISLAKSINADYLLFTTIYKIPSDENEADLSMELISTKTGEILNRLTSAKMKVSRNTDVGVTE